MTGLRSTTRVAILLSASFAGILTAHAIDYAFVDPAHRHELLLGTGHGYWPYAGLIALVAAVIGALTTIGSGFSRKRAAPDAVVLAMLQAGGFVALEAIERIGAGTVGRKFGPLIVLGVVLQVVLAFVIARVLRALERVAEALTATTTSQPKDVSVASRIVDVTGRHRSALLSTHPVRGPPLTAS